MPSLYNSLKEKRQYFSDIITINNKSELQRWLKFMAYLKNHADHLVFRGVCNASYMLSNSMQRAIAASKNRQPCPPPDELIELIKNRIADHKDVIQFLEENYKVPGDMELNKLAIAQHYGGFSPLLDITEDPYVAMHFCYCHSKYHTETGHETLKDYMALYVFDKSEFANLLFTAQKPLLHLSHNTMSIADGINNEEKIIRSNLRIFNQKGGFIYLPIEQSLEKFWATVKNTKPKIQCYHIHKGLSDELKQFCENNGITEKVLMGHSWSSIEKNISELKQSLTPVH